MPLGASVSLDIMTRETVLEALPLLPKFFTGDELIEAISAARKLKQRPKEPYAGGLKIREDVLLKLGTALPSLREKYGVEKLGIFGSVALGTAIDDSDVDIYVHMKNLHNFLELAADLEDILGREVDLISPGFSNKEMLKEIEEDVQYL